MELSELGSVIAIGMSMLISVTSLKKAIGGATFLGITLMGSFCSSRVSLETPNGWSTSIFLQQSKLTEELAVSDKEAATGLFSHNPYSSAQPISVVKVEPDLWIAVFGKADHQNQSKVRVERVADSEYRVVIKPRSDK